MHVMIRLFCVLTVAVVSCSLANNFPSPADYDLNNPIKVELKPELDEISGIIFYAKDTSIFAISDASGYLYKIFPDRQNEVQKWKFGKNHDYEDLALADSAFYILSSSGDIAKVQYLNDSIVTTNFTFSKEKSNQFETLYYDSADATLKMLCKNCKGDKKNETTVWTFSPADSTYNISTLKITGIEKVAKEFNTDKIDLKPSAACIDPLTKQIFILSSVNKILAIANSNGKIEKAYKLNPQLYKQPEGITFSNKGDLIISNESANGGPANILIIKHRSSK